MAYGTYYAFKRKSELDTTTSFTYILQVWLSIFGFSVVAIGLIWNALGGLSKMKNLPELTFSFSFIFLVLLLLIFIVVFLFVVIKLIKLFWNSWRGQQIRFDYKNTPPNIMKAIKPITDNNNLKEYRDYLSKLIDENNVLIREYYDVIKKLEGDNGTHKNKPIKSKPKHRYHNR